MTAYTQIKEHEELKELCIASYKPFKKPVHGYKLWDTISEKNGFFACIYQKENNIIIVYRGTELTDIEDLKNDKQMYNNILPDQTESALNVYDMVNKFCTENGMNLMVTGHSLGGSLAQIVSAFRNTKSVTFNAYGVKNMLPKDLLQNDKYNIINYCNKKDKITTINAEYHIGKCYVVESKNIFKNPHYLENMGSLYEREETTGSYLQYEYDKAEQSQKEFEEYQKYGRKMIHMPEINSDVNGSECKGSYAVSGYTREDGTKVDGHIRKCYLHGN